MRSIIGSIFLLLFLMLQPEPQMYHLDDQTVMIQSTDVPLDPFSHNLGESATLDDKKITVEEIIIIPGGAEPIIYLPADGQKQPIQGISSYAGYDMGQVFLPPESSLVLVKIYANPESSTNCQDYRKYQFRLELLSYPAVEMLYLVKNDSFGDYPPADTGCLSSGWLYFIVPVIQPDPNNIWITVKTNSLGTTNFAVWTLNSGP